MTLRTPNDIVRDLQAFAEQDGISEPLRYQSRMLAQAVDGLRLAQDAHGQLKVLLDQLDELGRLRVAAPIGTSRSWGSTSPSICRTS